MLIINDEQRLQGPEISTILALHRISQDFLIAHITAHAFPHPHSLIEMGSSTGVLCIDSQRTEGSASVLAGSKHLL